MNKGILYCFSLLTGVLFFGNVYAQSSSDPVLLTINGEKVTKTEFINVYKKNNIKNEKLDQKALQDYLELFINFKLKVKEAEEMGLDTTATFKTELGGYRKQLAQPYLNDRDVTNKIIEEAYERMKYDVRASHILVKLDQDALPKDTIAAWNKIIAFRNRIMKGEDFAAVAKQYSDDPSARDQAATKQRPAVKGNGGDLGYFTVFQMVYPFESAAYKTSVGDVSMPIRTKYGYHIIKVVDKRSAQGQIQVAHIMIRTLDEMTAEEQNTAKAKIDEIYTKIKAGDSFEDLAIKYSDDKGSGSKGGLLPWFGTGRMVPEFEKTAFGLKNNGDVSEPIKTMYGWHIIKRLDRKDVQSFNDVKNDIKTKVAKDSRSELSKDAVIKRLKSEYKFKEWNKSRKSLAAAIDSTIYTGTWSASKAKGLKGKLMKFADKVYTQEDLAEYIESHQTPRSITNAESVVNQMYEAFVEEKLLDFEDTQLERKYPEFKSLIKEYRDGILLFELTDQKVWSKAVKDTIGLQKFFEANRSKYMWDERVNATIYTCANEKIAKQTRDLLDKQKKGDPKAINIAEEINKDSHLNLKIESTIYSKGDNKIIDSINWKPGITTNIHSNNSVIFIVINEVLAPQPRQLNDCRGMVTSDYQTYLEKQWIEQLRTKYKYIVDNSVLNSIIQ